LVFLAGLFEEGFFSRVKYVPVLYVRQVE